MSEWDHLEIPELQQRLKEAPTYQERSAIRKVLHRKQLRGGGGKNIGKAAPSGATVKRRPSRESRSIGVVVMKRNSDVADERCSPEPGYSPSGRRDSVPNSASPTANQQPAENGSHPADEQEIIPAADVSSQQNKENIEVEATKLATQAPAPKPKLARQRAEPETSMDSEQQQQEQQQHHQQQQQQQQQTTTDGGHTDEAEDHEEEHMTENALESAIARSSDYNERRELRARLRKLRADKKAGRTGVRSRQSTTSESSDSARDRSSTSAPPPQSPAAATKDRGPEPEPEPQPTEAESTEPSTAVLPETHVQDTAESAEGEAVVATGDDINIVVEDLDPSSSGAERQASLDDREDKILRKSVTEPTNRYDDEKSAALAGDEGVSDFRTVLRRSHSPSRPQQSPSKSSEPVQMDFRTVLHKAETPSSKSHLEAGEHKYRLAAPKQEDFRGQLRRKVETKDCSSAAPKRSATAKQEDFRSVLRKAEEGHSPLSSLTPSGSPPSGHSPQPEDTVDAGADASTDADAEVTAITQGETGNSPSKSPVPPPVRTKPKVSPRPSPGPQELNDGQPEQEQVEYERGEEDEEERRPEDDVEDYDDGNECYDGEDQE